MDKEKLKRSYKSGSPNRWIWFSIGSIILLFLIFRIFSSTTSQLGLLGGDKVGIVRLEGMILSSEKVTTQLDNFADRSDIKAIVLRINSGGGVVGASQEIYEKVKDLKGKIPVIVSVDNVAASGAYYAALESEMIVANHGSLVGSIGVILDYPVLTELLDKIGLHIETIKSGALKDSGSPTRSVSKADREYFQAVVDDQHEQFIQAVAEGRNMPVEEVRKLADGRIFTGNQALELSLIDTIGTFDDAIAIAGQIGGIKGKPKTVEVRKKRKSIFDLLYSEIQQNIGSRIGVEPAYLWQ
ncbi:signal peptide peptidase SppA [bacterium]|nr:signal peptide peptidase SppA [bacterium]